MTGSMCVISWCHQQPYTCSFCTLNCCNGYVRAGLGFCWSRARPLRGGNGCFEAGLFLFLICWKEDLQLENLTCISPELLVMVNLRIPGLNTSHAFCTRNLGKACSFGASPDTGSQSVAPQGQEKGSDDASPCLFLQTTCAQYRCIKGSI